MPQRHVYLRNLVRHIEPHRSIALLPCAASSMMIGSNRALIYFSLSQVLVHLDLRNNVAHIVVVV